LKSVGVMLVAAGVAAGGYLGFVLVHHHFSTRTLNLCVVTDLEYRESNPDWESALKPLIDDVNTMFQGTGVQWRFTYGGDAYSPQASGSILERARLLEESDCKADVVLGLTGRPDKHADSVVHPFAHTLLIEADAGAPKALTATAIARTLAELFGVPIGARTLIVTDASQGILDASSVRMIQGMRDYDFAAGPSALHGKWEGRAAALLADALHGKKPHAEAEAHRILARAFDSGHKYEDATRHFREAVRQDPQNAILRFELAMALESDAHADEAIAELKTATNLDPENAMPHAAMGAVLLRTGRPDQAIEEFRAATRIEPRNASYQAALGEALAREPGRGREAALAFETAVRLKPGESGALTSLLVELDTQKRYQEVVQTTEADLRKHPASVESHVKAGIAYAYAGKLDAAEKEIRRAVELDPSNGTVHVVMARTYCLTGRYAEADAELRTAKAVGATIPTSLSESVQRKLTATARN
jgi:tetratricopeptide (TPR) repeat protein